MRLNKHKIVFIAICLFWFAISILLVTISLPHNPILNSIEAKPLKTQLKVLIPEGWGFFTRDPREERLYVFRCDSLNLKYVPNDNFSFESFFGASKKSRVYNLELGRLVSSIEKSDWHSWKSKNTWCPMDLPTIYQLNTQRSPLICGEFYVVKREPVPWAWASSNHVSMPGSIVKINIICTPKNG